MRTDVPTRPAQPSTRINEIEVRTVEGQSQVFSANYSGLPDDVVAPRVRQLAAQLTEWISVTQSRRNSLLSRDAYVAPDNPLAQMAVARAAVANDDIVGGAADVTEGLMFQGVQWEGDEVDDADVFNQISRDINLDAILRAAWRELFTTSQVVVAGWWERKNYKVRGRTAPPQEPPPPPDPLTGVAPPPPPPKRGNKKRKTYDVTVPTQLTILDSLRVIPVGNRLWGGDTLAWHGTAEEIAIWDSRLDQPSAFDPTMAQLILGRYHPSEEEKVELSALGVNVENLLELNPTRVWRHTLTRPSYARWADVRLKTTFPILDLKQQLREADRVTLIGAANYILLIKKGLPDEPAHQAEIDNLKRGFDVMAKVPVIVSDHRLEIEIISPKQDHTLQREKHDTLDSRLMSRVLGALTLSGSGQRNESTVTVARMVARLLESRRHMLRRAFEQHLAHEVLERNPDAFEDEPSLAFTPRRVQLDSDDQISQMILALRQQRELSRESILEYVGFDQEVEANRRIVEQAMYDPIFQTAVPFNSPLNNAGGLPPGAFGPTGGRPDGGGNPPPGQVGKPTKTPGTPGKAG